MLSKRIIFIVGPTAVGKTDVGLFLAQRLKGEIVSCDSMQVYKELSIINAKPSCDILKTISHHLIDVVSVTQEFDVGAFNELALEAIRIIHRRGKIPIVIGGSGLYMQVLLDGIFKGGEKDLDLRERLKQRIQKEGNIVLYEELKEVDRKAAEKIHPNDVRRLIRALEVYQMTKQPISELQKERKGLWEDYDVRIFGLNRNRQELYMRINRRVDAMFNKGLIDEIEKLGGKSLSKTAKGIIGIEEIKGYLEGLCDLEYAKEQMKQNTRRFAKRQLTWFRKEKRIKWIEINENISTEDVGRTILENL